MMLDFEKAYLTFSQLADKTFQSLTDVHLIYRLGMQNM